MIAMSGQLASYFAEAKDIAEQRFEELRNSILEEFSQEDSKLNADAFRDPDYQFVLKSAHQGYARSGDQELKDELVKLLAERSARPTGSRISMILNEAISIASGLTKEEYAALALTFSFKNVFFGSPSLDNLLERFSQIIAAFDGEIPESNSSFEYLSSMRCAIVNDIFAVELIAAIKHTYAFRLTEGFSDGELLEVLGGPVKILLLSGILTGVDEKKEGRHSLFSLKFDSTETLKSDLVQRGLTEAEADGLIGLDARRKFSEEKIKQVLDERVPNFSNFHEIWGKTSFKSCDLTGLGKALAHSALVGRLAFDTPLEVWVN